MNKRNKKSIVICTIVLAALLGVAYKMLLPEEDV